MSGLFTSLSLASRALDAQRMGLDVAGHNIANLNTPGYARRVVDLETVAAGTRNEAGGGVRVSDVRAIRDRFVERRLEQELPLSEREGARAEILGVLEASIGPAGTTIDARLSELFGAFSNLADTPTSPVARQDVLATADRLAAAFREMADRITGARREADAQVRAGVGRVNDLVEEIVAVNRAYGSATAAQDTLHLADRQGELVRELATLVDIDVLERAGGGVDVTFGNGRALVQGNFAYPVEAVSTPPSGHATLMAGTRDVTAEITGGRLRGYLDARDTNLAAYATLLDEAAYALANEVNGRHAAGFDLNGAPGGAFFVAPVAVAGAAAALTVDAALAADGRRLAAASVAEAGDNGNALSLMALRDLRALEGGTATFVEGWSRLVYRVGRDTRAALDARDSHAQVVAQVRALRDQVSGVSLDEEAATMLKFQRAYEANARFFRAVDETLGILFATFAR